MLNVEKETKLRPVNACLGYKEIHTLNVSQNVHLILSAQMHWPAYNKSAKILVLEFVVRMLFARSGIIIQVAYVILDFLVILSHLVKEQQVCIFII